MSALQVYDLYRATYSFKPLQTSFRGENVKLLEISKTEHSSDDQVPGQIHYLNKLKKLIVTCGDGNSIEIIKLSFGRKTMSGRDFNNGFVCKISAKERKFE